MIKINFVLILQFINFRAETFSLKNIHNLARVVGGIFLHHRWARIYWN